MAEPLVSEREQKSDIVSTPSALPEPTQADGEVAQVSPDGALEEDEYTGPAEDERGEIIIDYSYMERAAEEAANLPPISLTAEELQALRDLPTDFSYTLGIEYEDEEEA